MCEEQKDFYWDPAMCQCQGRHLVARGAGEEPGGARADNCADYFRYFTQF